MSEISRQLAERKSQAVSEISSTFDELEKALHQRKTALVTEVENICTSKQKVSGGTGECGLFCFFSFYNVVYFAEMREPLNHPSNMQQTFLM